jgi:CheY-like chemotaxis protein
MVALGMLDALGLEADIAVNGKEAIEALKLALAVLPYTIVLMDCQMPVMDGYEATTAIRTGEAGVENQNIPIVAMTANAMSSDREQCMAVGMDDFLTKPIDLEKLRRTLYKWIGQKVETHSKQHNAPSIVVSKPSSDASVVVQPSHNALLWDRDGALSRLGGREALLEKIVESFVSDAPIMISSLEEAIKTHNLEAAQLHAHSLKGSSANIGAVALAEISKLLEQAAKEGNIVRIKEKIGECEQILGDTLMVLRQSPNPHHAPVQKLRRLDPIAMMMELQELMQKLDDGLYIDSLSSKLFEPYKDEQFTQIMRELKKHIDQFEYDSAKEAVSRAMEVLG